MAAAAMAATNVVVVMGAMPTKRNSVAVVIVIRAAS